MCFKDKNLARVEHVLIRCIERRGLFTYAEKGANELVD